MVSGHLAPGNVSPNNSDAAAAPAAQMYFTAGPNHGSGGLLGYLTSVSTELTEGMTSNPASVLTARQSHRQGAS